MTNTTAGTRNINTSLKLLSMDGKSAVCRCEPSAKSDVDMEPGMDSSLLPSVQLAKKKALWVLPSVLSISNGSIEIVMCHQALLTNADSEKRLMA